jgi:hypothetical protein
MNNTNVITEVSMECADANGAISCRRSRLEKFVHMGLE